MMMMMMMMIMVMMMVMMKDNDDDNDDDEGEATRDRISEFSIDLRCFFIDVMILVMSCDVKVGDARRWDVM